MSFFEDLWDKIRRLFGRKKKKKTTVTPPEARPAFNRAYAAAIATLKEMGYTPKNTVIRFRAVPAQDHRRPWAMRAPESPTGWAGGVASGNMVTMPANPANLGDINIPNATHEIGCHAMMNWRDHNPEVARFNRTMGRHI
jgi:hypothetical protein